MNELQRYSVEEKKPATKGYILYCFIHWKVKEESSSSQVVAEFETVISCVTGVWEEA